MLLQTLWEYFGNFDDREIFRIVVLLMFLFGIPLTIGIFAKLVVWSARQVAECRALLSRDTNRPEL